MAPAAPLQLTPVPSGITRVRQVPRSDRVALLGTLQDRTRLLLSRRVPAVNIFGAQYYIMEHLGFRKIVDTMFMMGFLLSSNVDMQDSERYFRALRRAPQEIGFEPEPYKHYYARELPSDLLRQVDVGGSDPASGSSSSRTRARSTIAQRWMQDCNLFSAENAAGFRFETAVLV